VRELWYSDTPEGHERAEAFAQRENVPGRAVYDAINSFREDAKGRSKETVEFIEKISIDIDLKDIKESKEEVIKALLALPYPPSEIRISGHGIHADFLFKERIPVSDAVEADKVRKLRTRMMQWLCGDTSIDHDAALLRRPGTTNTKDKSNPIECAVVAACGATYDPGDLEDLLDECGGRPLFATKAKQENGSAPRPRNGKGKEWTGPIDIDAAFASIVDGRTCNEVQPSIIASLLMRGSTPDEVIGEVANRTMKQADHLQLGWDHEFEVSAVRGRIPSTLQFLQGRHDWSQETPPWLPAEFLDDWAKKQAEGKRPNFTRNGSGWHVRGMAYHKRDGGAEEPAGNGDYGAILNGTVAEAGETAAPKWPTPYSGRSPGQIPRRKWIMGQHYNKGKASLTVGPGAIGKSQHSLVEAVGMVIGRNVITDEILDDRYRVWVWNGEDDLDEVERRLSAICDVYNIDREILRDCLFLDDADTCHLEFAYGQSGRMMLHERAIQVVADRIRDLRIDVAIFDPLIALHTLPENDNTSLGKMIRTLQTRIAKPQACAVEVIHHPRKASKDSDGTITVDDVRGAGAIVTSARSVRLIQPMSAAESEKFGLTGEERHGYFRVDRGKANSAKRGPLYWVRLEERPIANGEGGAYGDVVTVCRKWNPPDATAKMTDVVAAAIREEVGKGEWLRERQARSKWAGVLIGRRMGLDTETKTGRQQAGDLLTWLIRRGVLATEFRTDDKRNTREHVVPGKFGET
jgi:hypothetical protein